MKILVTGGSGFIGTALIKHLLNKDHLILNLDQYPIDQKHQNLTQKTLNLLDYDLLKISINDFKPEVIFHMAGFNNASLSLAQPLDTFKTNVNITQNILEIIKDFKPHLIIPSTYYLNTFVKSDLAESPYILTKYYQENLSLHYAHWYKLPVTIIRLANLYGHNQPPVTFISSMIDQMMKKSPSIQTGNLKLKRDFIFLDDVISAFELIANNLSCFGKSFQLGNEIAYELEEVLSLISKLTDFKGEILANSKNISGNIVDELKTVSTELYKVLNWKPKYDLEAGLKKMIDQY